MENPLKAAKIEVGVSETHLGNFAANSGGDPSGNGTPGSGSSAGTTGPKDSKADEDKTWDDFKEKLQENLIEAAKENYSVKVNKLFESVAEDLELSQDVYQKMLKRAAEEYAIHGEQGSINALEALQDVRATISRAEEASKAVKTFEILEKGSTVASVVGAYSDIVDFTAEMEKAVTDPAHQSQHEGTAVGQATGAVVGAWAGAALIGVTAPVSVPMLVVGVVGATLIGIVATPLFGSLGGKLGGWFDSKRSERTVIR